MVEVIACYCMLMQISLIKNNHGEDQASPIGGVLPPTPLEPQTPPPRWRRAKRATIFSGFFSSFFAFNHDKELDLVVFRLNLTKLRLNSVKLRQKQLFSKLSKL